MNLKNLPDVLFTIKDAGQIEANLLRAWESGGGDVLGAADPRRLIFKTLADAITRLDARADYAAKMNLLAYAKEGFLDHLSAMVDTERLKSTAAQVMMQFSLSGPLGFPVVIPKGTRVSKRSSGVYFETMEEKTVLAGETETEISCICMDKGTIGNGYLAGEIDTLVDPVPYIASVTNIEMTSGGADPEDDDNLRQRTQMAPESFSTAGPDGAYQYHAKSVNANIADVKVDSETPGTVQIYVILKSGELPNETLLKQIEEKVCDRKTRPLTDRVTAKTPEVISYDVIVSWYLTPENLVFKDEIEPKIMQAVEEYATWQRSKIGRMINQTELVAKLRKAGADWVDVHSPGNQKIGEYQIAVAERIEVQYGGVIDA